MNPVLSLVRLPQRLIKAVLCVFFPSLALSLTGRERTNPTYSATSPMPEPLFGCCLPNELYVL